MILMTDSYQVYLQNYVATGILHDPEYIRIYVSIRPTKILVILQDCNDGGRPIDAVFY